jgi:hypothetical protein
MGAGVCGRNEASEARIEGAEAVVCRGYIL